MSLLPLIHWIATKRSSRTRETVKEELEALRMRRERVVELERDREALLRSYVGITSEARDELAPEERHRVYRMLELKVSIKPDGSLEASGELMGKASDTGANGTKLCCSRRASSRTCCVARD